MLAVGGLPAEEIRTQIRRTRQLILAGQNHIDSDRIFSARQCS